MTDLKYQRILLKLSGEALSPKEENGIDPQSANKIAQQVKEVFDMGADLAIVSEEGISGVEKSESKSGWIKQPLIIWECLLPP